jgi:hypothetical protein
VAGHFEKVNAGGRGISAGSDIVVTSSILWVPDNWVSGMMPISAAGAPPKPKEPSSPEKPDYCGSSEADLPEGAWPQACKKHDECYSSAATKDKCDRSFIFDILADCSGRIFVPAVCASISWRDHSNSGRSPGLQSCAIEEIEMKLRPGYKRLVASWAVIALPSLYYGIPYSEGDIAPRFTNIGGTVMWLLAMIILLLPLISLPYFLNRQDEPERDVDYAQQHED